MALILNLNQKITPAPEYYFESLLDTPDGNLTSKISLAHVSRQGTAFPSEFYLAVPLEMDESAIKRLVFVPYSKQLASKLESAKEPLAILLEELKTNKLDVIVKEWANDFPDTPGDYYAVSADNLLNAYLPQK